MKTYNEIVDNLENLEKKEATDVNGLDARVTALEESQPESRILYEHNIGVVYSGTKLKFSIISDKDTAYTNIGEIASFLYYKGFTATSKQRIANGSFINNQQLCIVEGVFASGIAELDFNYMNLSIQSSSNISIVSGSFTDIFYKL